MSILKGAAGLLYLLISFTVTAGDNRWSSEDGQPTVIELFTSQGCSSCPPAEKWLSQLKQSPKLWKEFIPLAFHVDYWDDLGWKDPFSDRAYTFRQYQYRKEGAVRSVYTPGFVVNGQEWRGGQFFPEKPEMSGKLEARLTDHQLSVTFSPLESAEAEAILLNIAILGSNIRTEIAAGENAGRDLTHDFTVLSYLPNHFSSNHQWEIALPDLGNLPGERQGIVIWLSKRGSIKPIQAIGGWIEG